MIHPTVFGRLNTLDVVRGMAILGILLANIVAFSRPALAEMIGVMEDPQDLVDRWAEALRLAFVSAKFRSSLAVLFGVGMYLQFQRRSAIDGNWPGGYLKRTAFLFLFGLLHFLLLWWGDILMVYAIVASIACLLVGVGDSALKWIAAGAAAVSVAFAGLFALLAALIPGDFGMGDAWSAEREYAVFAEGSYLEQLLYRLEFLPLALSSIFGIAPALFALFAIGILFGRSGVLAAPSQHPAIRNRVLAISLGIGLPLNMLALLAVPWGGYFTFMTVWELAVGPLLAPAYVMLTAMAAEARLFPRLSSIVSKVGRMALSCYILQTVLCVAIFYSWGLGLYGRLDAIQMLGVVVVVWLANGAFAHLWLSRFSIGPLEWALRSLTEGRRLPWRYERPVQNSTPPSPPAPRFEY
jgi:uncharacterized protein